ncbi:MAG: sigma-54-dependent Fis family transcriptional regulator [Phycisphaerales bacterium]|nr:sigma-54-dependent Fis family transcriptional regulator [Phycisphaerales bacterium]
MAHVLVVEDEENLRFSVKRALQKAGHEVADCATLHEAAALLRDAHPDLLLTDVNLSGEDGIELVRSLRADGFDGPIIVMTAYGSIDNAVTAMKDGADEYLQKPISLEALTVIIERALDRRREAGRLVVFQRMQRSRADHRKLLGDDPKWRKCLDLARRMAAIPPGCGNGAGELTTILLVGETGVGKGILARYIHDNCAERDAPFVQLNCAALPATLVESELFGHEKGAFTDARQVRRGFFEMADGGTIFLDEIGEMPIELQAKLLSILERGVFRRIGGTKEHRVKVRVIAATNHDLEVLTAEGKFRRDLYYRLNALTIAISPLRERGDDALVMADALLDGLRRKFGRADVQLGQAARAALRTHTWPGNVRELRNALQRAVMLSDAKTIEPADLGLRFQATKATPKEVASGELRFDFQNGVHSVEEVEKTLIRQALAEARGNVSRAAKLIGMNRSSLRYRIERYGMEPEVLEMASR